MKTVAKVYKGVGKSFDNHMAKKSYFIPLLTLLYRQPFLADCHPPIWMTPGKLQYYKAEMEPFIPAMNHTWLRWF